jgi:DNA-binding SARP family transcriptional activator
MFTALPPNSAASEFDAWVNGNTGTEDRAWPVRIYTLGRFTILCNDRPLTFGSKTPKKPLELLKIVIALGGRLIHINEIMNSVWPSEGVAARAAFDVALMRLRKLLGNSEALTLFDGKLTLNAQLCWVDAWAFERAITDLWVADDHDSGLRALALHRGPFLDRELETPSIAMARDRLASRFRGLVAQIGMREERRQCWDAAAQIYRRGIEQDSLAEEFYRGLIRCELERGNCAEAIKAFRRCRDMLSIVLRAKPSAETEQLHRRLLALQK